MDPQMDPRETGLALSFLSTSFAFSRWVAGGERANRPNDQVPEERDHGPKSYRNPWQRFVRSFFISRVREVLMSHKNHSRSTDHDIRMPRDRKSTRLNSSHSGESRMPSSA